MFKRETFQQAKRLPLYLSTLIYIFLYLFIFFSVMYLIIGKKHLRHSQSFRIMAALSCIQSTHFLHLFFTQFKVKDIDIACDPIRIRGFWKNDQAVLHLKPENNLPCILTVFFSTFCYNRMIKQ